MNRTVVICIIFLGMLVSCQEYSREYLVINNGNLNQMPVGSTVYTVPWDLCFTTVDDTQVFIVTKRIDLSYPVLGQNVFGTRTAFITRVTDELFTVRFLLEDYAGTDEIEPFIVGNNTIIKPSYACNNGGII